jgi:hypothetical protein
MISAYRTGPSCGVCGVVADLWRCFHGSNSTGSSSSSIISAKPGFDTVRGATTPAVYADDILGIECFRALLKVRFRPVFQTAAAILIGVFGVTGLLSELLSRFDRDNSCVSITGKGLEVINSCFVGATLDGTLEAALDDFRGGSDGGEALVS